VRCSPNNSLVVFFTHLVGRTTPAIFQEDILSRYSTANSLLIKDMTDKEILLYVFGKADIEVKTENNDSSIYLRKGDKNIGGYTWFYAEFEFNDNDELTKVYVAE